LTEKPDTRGQGTGARTIEKIVRAQLLLLVPVLLALGMLLLQRHDAVGVAGVTVVTIALAAISLILASVPGRELLALGRRALLVLVAVLFVGIAVLPRLGLYRPETVLSGSMRPTFDPGDLIIVRPMPVSDVRVGDVISYSVPVGAHQVETHRVIRVIHGGADPVIQTQGDANNWHDPWTAKLQGKTAWRLSLVIPYAGYAINALRGRTLHLAAVVVTPLLVGLLLLAQLWGISLTPAARRART
jgi:signal peptidase